MKKLFGLVIALAMVIGLVGMGTFALFSDTETSTGNSFTAGTLDLKVNGGDDPVLALITVGNMTPGNTGSVVVALSNAGSLHGIADIHILSAVNGEGLNPESETGNLAEPGELGLYLLITIAYDADNDGVYEITVVNGVALNSLVCLDYDLGPLSAGLSRNCKISWNLPAGTGNDVQGDTVTSSIEFSLKQA